MQSSTLRIAVVLALVALPACKRPDPGKKNKPVEAGLGGDPIGSVLSTEEAPKQKAPDPALNDATQVSDVRVRGWDPVDKKEIVGKARTSAK